MQSKTVKMLKSRLRKTVGDDFGIQWSDALLDKIIVEAQREYAIYTGALTGRYDFAAGTAPVQTLPKDFFRIIRILDVDGYDIPIVSFRRLADEYGDFSKHIGGKAKSICFNFDGFGYFRIFPVLPVGTPVGTMIYQRLPDDHTLEVKNISAIEQYALFQMYQFLGKNQARNCYLSFIDQVNRDQRESLVSGSKHIERTGVYF